MSAGKRRIITPLMVAFVLITTAPAFAGKVIYVDDDEPADFNNIQAAIHDSNYGDVVIVAEGRYFENINFNGKNITLISTDPCNPDVVAATIIDGSRNGSVVTFNSGEDANCVLNGFTITNGNAERGGGIYCGWIPVPPPPPPPPPPPGSVGVKSSPEVLPVYNFYGPVIINCTIVNNSAGAGGGMYNDWMSMPTLTNCAFNGNSASLWGGGMYNHSSSPTLKNCSFSSNSATYEGGGMLNIEGRPTLTNCTFSENSADYGGGMFNAYHTSESSPIFSNCTFNGNTASGRGGGMCNVQSSSILFNCMFSENSAILGGGMLNLESSPTLTNCTFNENSANSGGGISNTSYTSTRESSPILTNCTFSSNSARHHGGGMYNVQSSSILSNCTFSENSTILVGGMYNDNSSTILTNCTLSANCAEYPGFIILIYPTMYGLGGGMYNSGSSPTVTNCTFTGNAASYHHGTGGGMYNAYSNPIVTKCTFSGNKAGYDYHIGGGGLYNDEGCYTAVINCVFWGNGNYGISGTSVDATYSDIEGGWPGEGNIDEEPCFVDLGYWDSNDTPQDPRDDVWIDGDYHLLPDSPCINAGDPNQLYDPNEIDLDGKPRVIGCRIDMGAFEYRHLVPADVRIVPHTINLANRGKWITAYLQLPEEYNFSETVFCILLLEEKIQPEQLFINEKEQIIIASFNCKQLHGILNTGDIELKISAQLTDATVFEGTDVIKVIYEGGGKLAKLSGKASNPNPVDGSLDVGLIDVLSWTAGSSATSHDVYFGTSSPPQFIGNQTSATFDPGKMAFDTTYYWRIDEVNKWGTTTGDLWSFTTLRQPPPPP